VPTQTPSRTPKPTVRATLPPTETATSTITAEPTAIIGLIKAAEGGGAFIREKPGGKVLATLGNGATVTIIPNDFQDVNGVIWVHGHCHPERRLATFANLRSYYDTLNFTQAASRRRGWRLEQY
jgi:hypothetical protein